MRLLDQRAGNDRAVLEHVLQIYKVAVVHMLCKVIRVMEVDDAGLVRFDDFARQQDTRRQILGDLARHIVALHRVDGRVLVGILLLDLLVVGLDQRQDLFVRRVGLAHKASGVAVGNVILRHLIRAVRHDLVLDQILNLLHVQRPVHRQAAVFHTLGNAPDLHGAEPLVL